MGGAAFANRQRIIKTTALCSTNVRCDQITSVAREDQHILDWCDPVHDGAVSLAVPGPPELVFSAVNGNRESRPVNQ